MIVSIGLPDVDSLAYLLAVKFAEKNIPISYLCPFSSSREHLDILENLLDKCIMFDPVFCNTQGLLSDITYDRLIQAFRANSDLKYVFYDKRCLDDSNVMTAIRKACDEMNLKYSVADEDYIVDDNFIV